jgi:small subunit ribosomal protein S9
MTQATPTTFTGTGRRKTASARVRIWVGSGQLTVNGKPLAQYCPTQDLLTKALAPLHTLDKVQHIDASIRVQGGGAVGQAEAIAHGLARALEQMDAGLRPVLKKAGHMTRDPRMRERKKPGQPGARRRFQFSKR